MNLSFARRLPRTKLLCALVASCFATEPFANPVGPSVVGGQASFNTVGKSLTVTNSPNAIINWQGFSIGTGEITRFQQQSAASAVLNRVVGQDPSAILGTLSSNGRVYLVNPNGILFGQGSRVDVAGLVATTLNLSNEDFLAGRLNFEAGPVANSIVNQGEIVSGSGGRILLIAPDVQNSGLISSPQGEVVLAAGKSVQLVEADLPQLKVEVQAGGEALNVGQIIAEGGKIGVYAGLINQRGVVRADSVSQDATGRIVFRASDTTILDAGSVTSASGAKGGEVQVLGNKVGLLGDAKVDASGDAGGGTVLVGGDFQGKNPAVQNAFRTYVGPETSIQADALVSGDGGKAIVWSDDTTRAYGTISARGGAQSGNGGFVEVSGKNFLDYQGIANVSAPYGRAGSLLLDPNNIEITASTDSVTTPGFGGGDPNIFTSTSNGTSQIAWTTIKTNLASGAVYVTTRGDTGLGPADITILANSPDLATANVLRLISSQHINVNGNITNTGSGALEMYAGWDGVSTSTPALTGNTGNITQTSTSAITVNGLVAQSNGSVQLDQAANMVNVLAGTAVTSFLFKNGKALTIGSVSGVVGVTTSATANTAVNVSTTSGDLTVNNDVTATSTSTSSGTGTANVALTAANNVGAANGVTIKAAGGANATTGVSITAQGGDITLGQGNVVSALVDATTAGFGTPATGSVTLSATSGSITSGAGTAFSARGGHVFFGTGGAGTVTLDATNGIALNATGITATGGACDSSCGGGGADILIQAGGTVDLTGSTVTATGGALSPPSVGTVRVEVSTLSGNPTPSGDIKVENISANNVNIQQQGAGPSSILRASSSSLITAGALLMEVDHPSGSGGSIGTSAAPMRVQVTNLETHTHQTSPGIYIESPTQGLTIGGVSFFGGVVKGVQNVSGGDISIGVNGTLTLLAGATNSPCGTGTGGPVCTTSGDVTLRAEDMSIGHTVTATGTVTLAPYSTSRNIDINSSGPGCGLLCISPAEIQMVTAPTLTIGRSDSTGILYLNENIGRTNVSGVTSTLKLFADSIYENGGGGIGASGSNLDLNRNLELVANTNVELLQSNIYVASGNSLKISANSGGVSGHLDISGVAVQGGTVRLEGGNINIGSAIAPAPTTVSSSGAMTINATGGLTVQTGTTTGANARIQAATGQTIDAQFVNIFGAGTNQALILNTTSGDQKVTTSGKDDSGRGIAVINEGSGATASLANNGTGKQDITVNDADHVLVSGRAGDASLFSNGDQTLLIKGGGQNSLDIGEATDVGFSAVRGKNQQITAGTGSELGQINLLGGVTNLKVAIIQNDSGTQDIATAGTITATGGSANVSASTVLCSTVGSCAEIVNSSTGKQTIGAQGIYLYGGAAGIGNAGAIFTSGGVSEINVGSGGLTLEGKGGTSDNRAVIGGAGANGSTITINAAGPVVLRGGSATNASALIGLGGTVTNESITVNLNLTGATGNLLMTGGDGTTAGAAIGAGSSTVNTTANVTINASGNVTLEPGLASGARIGHPSTNPGPGTVSVTGTGASSVIALNSSSPGLGSAIRTTGDVTVDAKSITEGADSTIESGGLTTFKSVNGTVLAGTNTLNSVALASGNVTLSGSLSASALTIPSGITLNGTGTIAANVSNSGTIAPGTSAGILTINGNYTQTGSGALTVEIGGTTVGTEYDRLAVTGTASLAGTLNVVEGAVTPVPGTTYTVITCGTCTGSFAAVSAPTVNVMPTYGATSFTLPFTSFLNSWNAGGTGAWETASNWSRGVVPGSSDDVIIDVPSSVATITISSGTQAARSIVTNENLTLAGGSLNLAAPSTANGTFTLSGATLAGPGSLTLNGAFNWNGGTISNTGTLTTAGSSTISGAAAKSLAGLWTNTGAATISGGELAANGGVINSGTMTLSGGGVIRLANTGSGYPTFSNAAGGVVNVNSTAGWSFVSDPSLQGGIVDNAGTININNSTSWEAAFTNATTGSLNVAAGQFLSLQNGQTIAGTVNVATGATLWVSERHGSNALFNGTTINGTGTVQVAAGIGPVADFTNVNAPSATLLVASGGTANMLSGTTTFGALNVTGGTLSGGGNLNVTGSLTQSGGTQSGSGSTVLASGGTGTLGAVSVSRNLTNQGTLGLSGTSVSGLLTNSGTVNVSGSVSASGGIQENAGLIDVPAGQTLGVGGSGLVLAGGTLMGGGTISGNVNNAAGTVAPGASPGILTINGNYTQGPSGVLAVEVAGTTAGTQYDQLQVNGNVSLDGSLSTTLLNSFTPLPGDSFTFISSTGTITGSFANVTQPASLLPPTAAPLTTGGSQLTVNATSPSVPPAIAPTYNYTVVATQISSEPVENVLVPVLGDTSTTTSGDTTLEKKPPACS